MSLRRLIILALIPLAGCASLTAPIAPSTVQTIINDATMTLSIADVAAGIYGATNPAAAVPLAMASKQAHAALAAIQAAESCVPSATVVCAPITPESLLVIAFQNAVTGYFGQVLAVVPNIPPPAAATLGPESKPSLWPWVK